MWISAARRDVAVRFNYFFLHDSSVDSSVESRLERSEIRQRVRNRRELGHLAFPASYQSQTRKLSVFPNAGVSWLFFLTTLSRVVSSCLPSDLRTNANNVHT